MLFLFAFSRASEFVLFSFSISSLNAIWRIAVLNESFFDQKVLSVKNTIQKSMLHIDDITFYGKETARKWRKNDCAFADNAIHERRSYE